MWRISQENFIKAVRADLELSNAFGTQLARQFKIYAERVDNLEYKKANERIAYRLLFLASRFGVKNKDTIVIDAPITHELFANSINLARESVSREMGRLTEKGIIAKVDHRIIITDLAALKNIVGDLSDFKL